MVRMPRIVFRPHYERTFRSAWPTYLLWFATQPTRNGHEDIIDLFTYGTLMDADIMAALLGRSLTFQKALLNGYARHPVVQACYPGLIPAGNAQTEGTVYRSLQPEDWPILDWFEDTLYERQAAIAELDNGNQVDVQVYVVQADQVSALNLDADWCFQNFKLHDYHEYLPMCHEARAHYFQQKRSPS